jgi:hypothetical protein
MFRLIALALLAIATAAHAADGRKFAVMSLIGDQMLVVQYVPMIGGRIDRNTRDYLQLDDPVVDKTALLAADQALKQMDAANKPVLLFARQRSLYEASGALLEGGSMTKLLDLLRPLLQGTGATHLVLFTKVRSEARMQLRDATLGSGMIEGVGFYVDPATEIKLGGTGESATGFVGAFAYFQVSVIDLATGAVVRAERVTASRTRSAANTKAADVWTGISGQEKMRTLQDLVRDEVARTVPKVAAIPQ